MRTDLETVFTYAAPASARFGPGASDEIWPRPDGARCPTRPRGDGPAPGRDGGIPERIARRIRPLEGLQAVVHDTAHVEPTDASLRAAVRQSAGRWSVRCGDRGRRWLVASTPPRQWTSC